MIRPTLPAKVWLSVYRSHLQALEIDEEFIEELVLRHRQLNIKTYTSPESEAWHDSRHLVLRMLLARIRLAEIVKEVERGMQTDGQKGKRQ